MKAHLATILVLLIIIGGGYLICVNFTAPQIGMGVISCMILILLFVIFRFVYFIIYDYIHTKFFKTHKKEDNDNYHWND